MDIKDLELISIDQKIYDAFNDFTLSSDLKIFGKLLARVELFQKVKDIPGDIIECGVFKGTGIFTFLKLKRYLCPNTYKKIIGFDFFNSKELKESLSSQDKKTMSLLFEGRNFSHDVGYKKFLHDKILESGFFEHEFELVEGDVSKTTVNFVETRPGLKISLLYLDLDLEHPTYDVLNVLWDKMSSGGIVVFDEYAYHSWSESLGVDRFFENKNIKINSLNYTTPSAYVVKP